MKRNETILKNLESNKEIQKAINKISFFNNEDFINHAKRYIQAIKEGRMMCKIQPVSKSGMSRNMRFFEINGSKKDGFRTYNFWSLFRALGYTDSRNSRDTFLISGCGMDMVFHTNYSIIHRLGSLGFLTKKEVDKLAQRTPHVV